MTSLLSRMQISSVIGSKMRSHPVHDPLMQMTSIPSPTPHAWSPSSRPGMLSFRAIILPHVQVYCSVHNAYMIASGWRIVLDTLRGLAKSGLKDSTALAQLQQNPSLCSRYLALCDILNILVNLAQIHFSVLATTTRMSFPSSLPSNCADACLGV